MRCDEDYSRGDRLAQCEHAEDALVDAVERFPAEEALQPLNSERELPDGQGSLVGQAPLPQPLKVLRRRVLRPVDDPQVLAPAHLHSWLDQAAASVDHADEGLHDHPFASRGSHLLPPLHTRRLALRIVRVDHDVPRGPKQAVTSLGETLGRRHVPEVVPVSVGMALSGRGLGTARP